MSIDTTPTELAPFLDRLSPEQWDAVPLGVVQLDADGTIVSLNRIGADLCEWSRDQAVGCDFFLEVFPAACVAEIVDRFVSGFARRQLDETFRVTFLHGQVPRTAMVRMYFASITESIWIFCANPDGSQLQEAA